MSEKRWSYGDTIVMRYPPEELMLKAYLAKTGSLIPNVAGWPHIVLRDADDIVALYLPEGTPLWRWDIEDARFRQPRITQGESVRLLYPGKPFEVTLFYETGSGQAPWVQHYFPGTRARFYGWKVDITSPFCRTEVGFDVIDKVLDIIVEPDRRYRWKDEDELENLVRAGLYSAREAESLHAIGEDVITRIEAGDAPFDGSWNEWQAPSDLAIGGVPEGWQYLPVMKPYTAYPLSAAKSRRSGGVGGRQN